MCQIVTDMSRASLASALETNLIEELTTLAQLPGGHLHRDREITWFVSGIQSPYLNGVVRAQFTTGDVHAGIEKNLSYFTTRGIPMSWMIGPSTSPNNLCEHLKTHGLKFNSELHGMAIDLRAMDREIVLPKGLVIERVQDNDMLNRFVSAFISSFQIAEVERNAFCEKFGAQLHDQHHGLRSYIGLLNGEPVATSSLFLKGGVAGIYHIGTIPEARRRGIGRAMTLTLLHEALILGYSAGVLAASRSGQAIYSKIGFKEYCILNYYLLDGKMNQQRIKQHFRRWLRWAAKFLK